MLVLNIEFRIEGKNRGSTGESTGAVGFSTNEINGDREVNISDQVSQEEKRSGGDTHDDRRRGNGVEIVGDLGGKLRYSARNLVLCPKHLLYVRIH